MSDAPGDTSGNRSGTSSAESLSTVLGVADVTAADLRAAIRGRRFAAEVAASGLVEHLDEAAATFWDDVRPWQRNDRRYNTGRVTGRDGYTEGVRLYAAVRILEPEIIVETGVCNGVSTAFLLLALSANGAGRLYSIDLPEIVGVNYPPGAFWEGKGGAAVPADREVGWMIPKELRCSRWELRIGRSQDLLTPLLNELHSIDFFLHDSEHSFSCMRFELREAFRALRLGGVIAADDVCLNGAWRQFVLATQREPIRLGTKLELIRK